MKSWMLTLRVALLGLALTIATSCGNSAGIPTMNGIQGPLLTVVNGQILLTFKFLNMQLDAGLGGPIPDTHSSSFVFSPNVLDGGMMLEFTLDVEDLSSVDIGVGDANTLPDGRPVPGIPGGRLENSLRIDTHLLDMSFYFHEKIFGIWIPMGFETAGISGYWNMAFNGKTAGMFAVVGNDNVHNYKAGALILLNRDSLKDKQLQKLLELSKRNPHMIY